VSPVEFGIEIVDGAYAVETVSQFLILMKRVLPVLPFPIAKSPFRFLNRRPKAEAARRDAAEG
jgi:hypothetical protein